MIKVHASLSKKFQIPGVDYSSRFVGASIEVEVADGATAEQIKAKIAETYTLLEDSINTHFAAQTAFGAKPEDFNPPVEQPKAPATQQPSIPSNNGNGQKNGSVASDKQIGLIINLAKDANVTRSDLNTACQKLFNTDVDHLSKMDASSLIGNLQKIRDGKLDGATLFGNRPAKAA